MTLTELRYFIALAHEKHFGRAAMRCFVSQPTLSVAIKKFEDELGVVLFERTHHTVRLTESGQNLIGRAQAVLDAAEKLTQSAQAEQDPFATPIKIGAIYTIGPYLFPHLIQQLRAQTPQLILFIEENFTSVLLTKLREGELDVAILALPIDEPDLAVIPIYDEAMRVLLPANHVWAKQKSVAASDLSNESMLMLGEGHCFRDQVLSACPTLIGPGDSNRVVEGGSLETIRHMVASGLGISVLPATACQQSWYPEQVLVTRPFKAPEPSRLVGLVYRESFPRTEAVEAIAKAIQASPLPGVRML